MGDVPQAWRELATQLRVDSIRSTTAAGSGHPSSGMSAADLMAVLLAKYLRYDWQKPTQPNNDRLVFSKGHAAPLLYAMFKAAGAISDQELLTLRKLASRLEGHPNPRVLPLVDVATGSLGQGLPMGFGMALSGKYLDKLPFRVWVLLGDSEMAEGSISEALDRAAHYRLNNLIAILDMNRLGQSGETELGWNSRAYAQRAEAFGWHTIEIDGHDLAGIDRAYGEAAAQTQRPTLIVARTVKGQGFSLIADQEHWHGKALNRDQMQVALEELGGDRNLVIETAKPEDRRPSPLPPKKPLEPPSYLVGEKESTRKAFGDTLVALGAHRPDLVVLDGEVGNSTYTEEFAKAYPDRFFQIYIAEQLMLSAATGISVLGKPVFAATFAAFFTRAFDQIRMAAISGAALRLCGSHAGVSIGEDGPSQMGLEDLAMMRAVFGSTVLYPCDANQTVSLVEQMVDLPGISYLRATREKTPVLYPSGETFRIGGSRVLRDSEQDQVAVIAAGITVHEALKAYETLRGSDVAIRVIDAYSVKPIDVETLLRAVDDTGGKLVVVEDHWPEGGLGEAVLSALAAARPENMPIVSKLAVKTMPGSGTPEQLMDAAGINAEHIAHEVMSLVEISESAGR